MEIPESPEGLPQEEQPPSPEFAFSPPAPPAHRVPSPTLMAGPGSPLRASLNPSEARAIKAAARRRAAAEFLAAQTGIRLPAESDLAFRAALRDGVALCRLLNALRPGAVGKVSGSAVGVAVAAVRSEARTSSSASLHVPAALQACPPTCVHPLLPPPGPVVLPAGHRPQPGGVQQPHWRCDPQL